MVVDVDHKARTLMGSGSGPIRSAFAQSTATSTRLLEVSRQDRAEAVEPHERVWRGSDPLPPRYIRLFPKSRT